MTYQEVLENAKSCVGPYCKTCPVCNGLACKNKMPGPGAKGSGSVFIRNYQKWQELCVNMDTIHENVPIDTHLEIFGKTLELPVFAAPIRSLHLHYGDKLDNDAYDHLLIPGCHKAGIAAFCGDDKDPVVMDNALDVIAGEGGVGIPTLTPWRVDEDLLSRKLKKINETRPMAASIAIDAAGLPFFTNIQSYSVAELREVISRTEVPFILKGVMTVQGAQKAVEAGAAGIVVSNHGGRVLDQCPATAEVLPAIADAVGGKIKIFVDGGIRTGIDIFKALALGADAVLIGRPFINVTYGGGEEGIRLYVEKLTDELRNTMLMCGAAKLSDIRRSMLFGF